MVDSSFLLFIFFIGIIVGFIIIYLLLRVVNKAKLLMWKTREEKRIRKETREAMSRTIKGRIGEQLSPILPEFPGSFADARFLGSPIDFVVFEGYTNKDIQRVVFVEVKTGKKARLNSVERQVRQCIKKKKVDWKEVIVDY